MAAKHFQRVDVSNTANLRLGQRVLLMSSRPGRFVKEWKIDIKEPRRIDSPEIALMAREITDDLRSEIRRHADA